MKAETEFKKVLTLLPVVLFGLAYMVPMTVFTTYGIVSQLTMGMLPAAYIVTLLTMLFTAYSYGRMVKAFPYTGSAYTYAQKSLNSHVGFFYRMDIVVRLLIPSHDQLPGSWNLFKCGISFSS